MPEVKNTQNGELQKIQLNILREFDLFCREHNIKYYIIGGSAIGCVRHKGFIPWDDDIDVGLFRKDYDRFVELAHQKWNGKIQIRNYKFTDDFYHCLTHVVDTSVTVIDHARIKPVYTNVWIDVNPLDGFPRFAIRRKLHYMHLRTIKTLIVLSKFEALFDMNKRRSKVEQFVISIIKKVNFAHHFDTKKLISKLENGLRKYDARKERYVGNFLGRYKEKEIMPTEIFDETILMDFESLQVPVMKDYDTYLRNLYGDYMQLPPVEKRIGHSFEAYWKI